ncbi:MAG: TetR family transcriptional regulator [Roseibium sp.]|uniref:TetR/AcrR family transcriptional regulator n=1 Tax=Roseibium sp. TaxID=1936156 RepID=UPI002620DEB8|nr:TetR/AcrR family transcriptional regulator [Roseibium sp.]MCV0424280.1 TetR family transcriptional regulator [Roseibium sp.]
MPVQLEPGQRRRPKQLRSRMMVEVTIEAARQVFAEHGFEAATTNQIAARAGISIGSLYQYFPNKDALILEVQKAHHGEVLSVIRAAMDRSRNQPLKTAIRTIIGANLNLHLRTPQLHAAFEEWIPTQSRHVDRDSFQNEMAKTIGDFLASRPEIPNNSNLDSLIFVIMNMVRSIMHAAVQDNKAHHDRDRILTHLSDSILGCLPVVDHVAEQMDAGSSHLPGADSSSSRL